MKAWSLSGCQFNTARGFGVSSLAVNQQHHLEVHGNPAQGRDKREPTYLILAVAKTSLHFSIYNPF